jgi:DNA-binding CsgD family transcriptional regulator
MTAVALDLMRRQQRSDAQLASYGLTRREIEIARLLASRRRTSEIAELLGVSVHTARRHTEQSS